MNMYIYIILGKIIVNNSLIYVSIKYIESTNSKRY